MHIVKTVKNRHQWVDAFVSLLELKDFLGVDSDLNFKSVETSEEPGYCVHFAFEKGVSPKIETL